MMELLDSRSMLRGLGALAKCEIHMMYPVGVEDGEWPSASLGVCAPIGGVVAKLQNITGFSERGPLKIEAVPLLQFNSM